MRIVRAFSTLWEQGIISGVMSGMLAFAALNLDHFYLGAAFGTGLSGRSLMPDFFSYLQIDAYVGAGSGFAASLTGRNIAGMLDLRQPQARTFQPLVALFLGAGITLIVNLVLLAFSLF